MAITYVTFYFAALGGMIGVSSLAGRTWTTSAVILFLIALALALFQRAVTGFWCPHPGAKRRPMQIEGDRITLRDQLREADTERHLHWLNLEEWNYFDEPDVPFEPLSWAGFEARWRPPKEPISHAHRWQIDLKDGRHIGWVNYYHLDEKAQRAYVGICIPEPEFWNRGYGTEAVCWLVDYLFAVMRLKEVRTATWTGNLRMVRCAEKSGLREIARMPHRAPVSVRGEPLERIGFGLSRAQWQADRDAG
jgi:RimJ/RimL family protein N-acetyltransferase